jgi:hypothetical protein
VCNSAKLFLCAELLGKGSDGYDIDISVGGCLYSGTD